MAVRQHAARATWHRLAATPQGDPLRRAGTGTHRPVPGTPADPLRGRAGRDMRAPGVWRPGAHDGAPAGVQPGDRRLRLPGRDPGPDVHTLPRGPTRLRHRRAEETARSAHPEG